MSIAYFSEALKKAGFRHGFSTRSASQEDIGGMVGVPFANLARAKQVHSARVVEASHAGLVDEEADALVSRDEFAVAIQTADCVPVLVADRETGAVAAIHAGWRGIVSGIVPTAIELLGGDPANRIAAVGPCIMVCSFETGVDVAAQIANATDASVIASRHGDDKAMVDLRLAVRIQLERAGSSPTAIDDVAHCTYCETDTFFSYRRDRANVAERAGRMISAIRPRGRMPA